MSAELKCSDGTIVKISDETEAELRKAFGPKSKEFVVGALQVKKYEKNNYAFALDDPYKNLIFPDTYVGRMGFNKDDVKQIIKGLEELI